MSNDRLLQNVVSILIMAGYNVSERCEIRPRSFDLMTSDGKHLLVIKVVSQIDSVNEDIAWDLDKIARHLGAVPLIIGERARDAPLERGAIYLRYGINAVSSATLYDYLAEGELPLVYASPGGLYVNIDADRLRELREEHSMSLGDLAHALGVSRRTISKYEGGMGTTLDVAMRLEELFNDDIVMPIDLLSYTPTAEERSPASLPSGNSTDADPHQLPADRLRSIGISVPAYRNFAALRSMRLLCMRMRQFSPATVLHKRRSVVPSWSVTSRRFLEHTHYVWYPTTVRKRRLARRLLSGRSG